MGVISVAAVDAQRQRASYSNTGASIDIAAPGGNYGVDQNGDGYPDGVLSTGGLGGGEAGYTFLVGTSMAAPHVSGVIALMKSVNPALESRRRQTRYWYAANSLMTSAHRDGTTSMATALSTHKGRCSPHSQQAAARLRTSRC